MDFIAIFFATAVAWFSMICFRIAALIYQFVIFPRTFGKVTNVSLSDLSELAASKDKDLPDFHVVIPAYLESMVIDGTIRRIAAINYPRTHLKVWVVTYEDEPPEPGQDSTFATAKRTEAEINAATGRNMVQTLLVPAGFDGRFPGDMDVDERFVGKPRGLNYALRAIHERNEREERTLYIGKMARLGRIAALDAVLSRDIGTLADTAQAFDPEATDFIGPCTLSRQLDAAQDLLCRAQTDLGPDHAVVRTLTRYVATEAPRFLRTAHSTDPLQPPAVMPDRVFLHEVMTGVEAQGVDALSATSLAIEARLGQERPHLKQALDAVTDGLEAYQLTRQVGGRWMAVYDADADAPVDLFRHMAARRLTDPGAMGFQGPVSPIANYLDVHPLCRLGGLWMGFWHSTGYPRLMSKGRWAHVLAGTNWCFRIDGFRDGSNGRDRLIGDAGYDEAKRELMLSFDPQQLTEDLEVAVRVFDTWQVNAHWHPYVEFEQVPATPGAMIIQRRRWTLGTLQTVAFMLKSRLPLMQKLKYGLLPLDIVVSGSGPIVTVLLWIFIYTGDLISSPILIAWSIFLTFGNLVYVLPYLLAHTRFVMGFRRFGGMEHVTAHGPEVAKTVLTRLAGGKMSNHEAAVLHRISALFEQGRAPGGWITKYLSERCIDTPAQHDGAARLLTATPTAIFPEDIEGLARTFDQLTEQSYVAMSSRAKDDPELIAQLESLQTALEKAGGLGEWRELQRRERRQIWIWAFVYLFWQLIPYYSGLINWVTGRDSKTWVKTPRTRKANLNLLEQEPAAGQSASASSAQADAKR